MVLKKQCECKQFTAICARREELAAALRGHQSYQHDPENHQPVNAKNV